MRRDIADVHIVGAKTKTIHARRSYLAADFRFRDVFFASIFDVRDYACCTILHVRVSYFFMWVRGGSRKTEHYPANGMTDRW